MSFGQNNQEKSTEKAIVETIVFFDMFDFPLTDLEVWRFIGLKWSLSQVRDVLQSDILSNYIQKYNGFYSLKNREGIIEKRTERYSFTDRKIKRALWVARLFSFLPWIKMVSIGNIMGAHNLRDGSDIDLFIVTEPRRIWITRFFCVILMKILWLRPKKDAVRDKICLSFFISEEFLNLKYMMLDKNKDAYFIYWLTGLVPIYDKKDIYSKFIKENHWIYEYLPNWDPTETHRIRTVGYSLSVLGSMFRLFGLLEGVIKRIQLRLMSDNLKNLANKDTRVILSDKALKLHANDRRQEYQDKLIIKMKEYENIK